jgi:hypothetical protein
MATKYTKDRLEPIVASSISLAEVMRKLGIRWSGGQQQNIKRWIGIYGLDTSHFLGQGANRGVDKKGGPTKLLWSEVLVLKPENSRREAAYRLRRAMIESGKEYKCVGCGNPGVWRRGILKLQVNHKNGKWWDNRPFNVEFVCPNCHTQTEGWSGDRGGTDVTSIAVQCQNRRKARNSKKG